MANTLTNQQLQWMIVSRVRADKATYGTEQECTSLHTCKGTFFHSGIKYSFKTRHSGNNNAIHPFERIACNLKAGSMQQKLNKEKLIKLAVSMGLINSENEIPDVTQILKDWETFKKLNPRK